jgi:tetratricopeptide (TPR) repeat protein
MALDEGLMGGRAADRNAPREQAVEDPEPSGPPAYTGRMATVMDLIAAGRRDAALDEALAWRGDDPADVMALIALGEAFEADAKIALASRAYGSIIDLFPARADLRRFAGERLDRLAGIDDAARTLAIDTYRRAVEQRPDHLTGHRLLAMALVRAGRHADAFAALEHGLAQSYPPGRFAEGDRILREDLGLVAAAWLGAGGQRADIDRRLRAAGAKLETEASLRFVLTWETDANDVDFHIRDARKGHAFYSQPELRSGGSLYADVTTGYGPECFTIRGKPTAAPYRLSIHYYSRGPMGYGMGKLEIVRHDGKGGLSFEERPYVVMNDQAFVDLGTVE